MDTTKAALSKLVARRRLEGGEFSYVLISTGQTVEGKKAAYNLLKEQAEDFEKFKSSCLADGEDDQAFDARVVKMVPILPYEEVKEEEMEVDGEETNTRQEIGVDELFRIVSVGNLDKKATDDEVETFFKKFDGVANLKKFTYLKSLKKNGPKKPVYSGKYNITFSDAKSASEFLSKSDEELTFMEKVLTKELLRKSVQQRVVRSQFGGGALHSLRLTTCIPLESGQEDSSVLVHGIGKHPIKEVQEFFVGTESQFEGISSVDLVLHAFGPTTGTHKLVGYLVKFESKAACDKFVATVGKQGEAVKFKEKEVRCHVISKTVQDLKNKLKANNLTDDDELDKKLVLLRLKHGVAHIIAEEKIGEVFENVASVQFVPMLPHTAAIITFETAAAATKAVESPPAAMTEVASPLNLISMEEYVEQREAVLEESKVRLDKLEEQYKTIKADVEVKDNVITLVDHRSKPGAEAKIKKAEALKEKKAAEKATPKKEKEEKKATQTVTAVPQNPMLAKRQSRGPGGFDNFVGVLGFQTKIKNMGKATDMDICNYFIHNHKDVMDVKFVNWTDVVFAKFKNSAAAERFIGLNYVMFFGIDLRLIDVDTFMKKRTPPQKEELAKILTGKKLADIKVPAGGVETNGVAKPKDGASNVELSAFTSKQAGSDIRKLFIEHLNLNQEDVGQPSWVKEQKGFKARMQIKLEENAIGYLVKKWNEMEITVEGETVSAAVPAGSQAGVKRLAGNKRNSTHRGGKKAKFNFVEDY